MHFLILIILLWILVLYKGCKGINAQNNVDEYKETLIDNLMLGNKCYVINKNNLSYEVSNSPLGIETALTHLKIPGTILKCVKYL